MHRRWHGRSRHLRAHVVAGLLALAGCEQAPVPDRAVSFDPEKKKGPPARESCLDRHRKVEARYQPIVKALCADLHNLDGVGASIAIAEKGKVVLSLGVGQTCSRDGKRATRETIYRVGSVTKVFTAATILALMEKGHLDLADPVRKHLPSFRLADPEASEAVTIQRLLQHQSGIPEPSVIETAKLPQARWYETLAQRRTWFPPGRLWSYSNAGFGLLGSVIEERAAMPYEAAVEKSVLAPLALADTFFDAAKAVERGPAACGHLGAGSDRRPVKVTEDFLPNAPGSRWNLAAGGALASAEDLVRFGLSLTTQTKVFGELARETMLNTKVETKLNDAEFQALGLAGRRLPDGTIAYRHSGNTGDFAADLYVVPDKGFAVAVLSNTRDHFRPTIEASFKHVLGSSLSSPAPAPRPISDYEGDYAVAGWEQPVVVTKSEKDLVLSSPQLGVEALTLRHVGHDSFTVTWPALGTSERISFAFEDDERWMRGRQFVGRATESP